ncbi:MAG: hypothetical protein AB7G80_09890 [Dongiaceae bacterium]
MSFLNTLTAKDRERLRAIIKRVHLRHYPKDMITNYEADRLIEAIGPEVAAKLIKEAVDRRQIN